MQLNLYLFTQSNSSIQLTCTNSSGNSRQSSSASPVRWYSLYHCCPLFGRPVVLDYLVIANSCPFLFHRAPNSILLNQIRFVAGILQIRYQTLDYSQARPHNSTNSLVVSLFIRSVCSILLDLHTAVSMTIHFACSPAYATNALQTIACSIHIEGQKLLQEIQLVCIPIGTHCPHCRFGVSFDAISDNLPESSSHEAADLNKIRPY